MIGGLHNLLRTWFIMNQDNFMMLKGSFPPVELTSECKNVYAQHTALGMQKTILQFLHGEAERINMNIMLYNEHSFDTNAQDTLAKLKEWSQPSSQFKRPAICTFWVGDAHVEMKSCIIENLSNISYDKPTMIGALRAISLSVSLVAYEEYSLNSTALFETRYHRVKTNDYYEMLCEREYHNPMLGDVIRHRHMTNPNPQIGDVIKLPSVEALRKETIEPKSLQLKTMFGRKDTPQRRLRQEMFDRRGDAYVSHVLIED